MYYMYISHFVSYHEVANSLTSSTCTHMHMCTFTRVYIQNVHVGSFKKTNILAIFPNAWKLNIIVVLPPMNPQHI